MYKLNFKVSPNDYRDHTVKLDKSNKLTTTSNLLDLSNFCSSIKDQGKLGSCTAFAAVSLLEFIFNKNGKHVNDALSELFLYYTTRVDIEKTSPNDDSGAYLRDVLKAMVKYGVATEIIYPYNTKNYNVKPEQKVYDDALNYQVLNYAAVKGNGNVLLNSMKLLLQSGSPFIGGVVCYQNFLQDRNGVIPNPRGRIIGGHAILFVGYDDRRQLLKFKNSWGNKWGDRGYGYLPYAYVLSNLVNDVWTVNTAEYQNKAFDIINPIKRISTFNSVLQTLLNKLTETENVNNLLAEIENISGDLLPEDKTELVVIIRRFHENIAISKSKLFK